MLIYYIDGKTYCYIHIPKNSGKFLRNNIIENSKTDIIKSYWGIDEELEFDLAHIPYMLRDIYVQISDIIYYTYSRNPYHRMISAYFYKNPKKTISHFNHFIKNELVHYDFNTKFNSNIIHYYPQYLFLCDFDTNTDNISKDIDIKQIETYDSIKKYKLNDYYTKHNIQIINKIYYLDFKLFGYEQINFNK